jgi:4-diphosphocytidyl-2-C-methyl-D-erythritol kinase
MELFAPAKINLSLDIIGRRPDGYHILDMVMQSVSLFDTVSLTRNETGRLQIICNENDVPCGEENTVFRAAKAFFQATGVPQNDGLLFSIEKKIPRQAGLGGGSTDAAAALKLLNCLYRTNLSADQLREIAVSAGADVPFCMEGGTAHVTGIGENIEQLPPMVDCHIVICRPDVGISTKAAYSAYDQMGNSGEQHTPSVLEALKANSVEKLGKVLGNAFEEAGVPEEITDIEEQMLRCGCEGACMSGSGSAVFGLFREREKAEICCESLRKKYSLVYSCRPVPQQKIIS